MANKHTSLAAGALLLALTGSPAHAEAPPGRYQTPAAGLVLDTVTGLTWTAGAQGPYGIADGFDACARTNPDGKGAFRLPTRQELITLIDITASPGQLRAGEPAGNEGRYAMDLHYFRGVTGTGFWTSTRGLWQGAYWAVSASSGFVFPVFDANAALYVRCVRRGP